MTATGRYIFQYKDKQIHEKVAPTHSMTEEEEPDQSIIVGASYAVYDRDPSKDSDLSHTPGGLCGGSTHASFYDADGTLLVTLEHHMQFASARLDRSAPVPRPASYRRIWWPGIDVGYGMVKGAPGYAVMMHDKHGHRIGWIRLEYGDEAITTTEFDLSHATEEPADFSRRPDPNALPSDKTGGWGCTLV